MPTPPKPKGKDNVFTRKIGPLPMWVWVAVIAAIILAYVMLHKKKSSSGTSSGGGTKTGSALVPPILVHGARGPRGRRGKRGSKTSGKDDDDKEGHEGPEREWLEKKTGSEHPWSYLAKHDESIDVGPHGSRTVVHDGSHRRGRGKKPANHHPKPKHGARPGDEHKAPRRMAVRGVPGAGPVKGQLVSYTTPEDGPTPSLAQVASQYNTAPDAIIEEATGRGNPHGAMWRRYVAADDWQAPLPHGTDMTILAPAR